MASMVSKRNAKDFAKINACNQMALGHACLRSLNIADTIAFKTSPCAKDTVNDKSLAQLKFGEFSYFS